MSFRTDKRWHNHFDDTTEKYTNVYLYDPLTHFTAVGGNEIYFVWFYKTADDTYYSSCQFHITVTPEDVWYQDRDEVEYTYYRIKVWYWDMIEGSADHPTDITPAYIYPFGRTSGEHIDTNKMEYMALDVLNNRFLLNSNYQDYISYSFPLYSSYYSRNFALGSPAYTSDMSKTLTINGDLFNNFDMSSEYTDIGYLASSTPIETIYKIDTTKIPDNYYITIEGDTLYDYSITNPETGQSDTINNYITNNYTYITSPDNNNSGGGSVGGSVIVGGKVDIGGSVGVDINVSVPDININVNTGNGGEVGVGSDLSIPDTDIFNSYYDEALDESSGFRRFLGEFFSFLPPEITLLLGIGLTFVILSRLLGR